MTRTYGRGSHPSRLAALGLDVGCVDRTGARSTAAPGGPQVGGPPAIPPTRLDRL